MPQDNVFAVLDDATDLWTAKDSYEHGLLLIEKGEKKKAQHAFEHAIDLRPEYAYAYWQLGKLVMKESKGRERARELFNKAIEFDKNFSKVHNSLGVLLYSRYNEYDAW